MLYRVLDVSHTMQALRQAPFRWWLVERMVGASTWAMRAVARGWLVYQLTGSVLALAWVEAVRALVGIVVAPAAGVICDRVEKRMIMLLTRVALVATTLTFAALIFLDVIQLWHIVAITIAEAVIYSVMDPALQSVIPEIIARPLLLGATSAMFVVEGVLGIAGGAVGGLIVAAVGPGWVFLANAPLFALAAFSLAQMPRMAVAPASGHSVRTEIVAGLRYLSGSPVLLGLLGLAFARLLFTQPFSSFMAAFAKGIGFDAAGLGLLTAATSAGALASSLIVAAMGGVRNKGALLLASGAAGALCVALLMATGAIMSPFFFVILAGAFANAANVFSRTLMVEVCDPAYRGRLASVADILSYTVSLTIIPAGLLADRLGVPLVIGVLALLVAAVHVAAAARWPRLRTLR
jgi:MFS family permease